MLNIAVFGSGKGSNFRAILTAIQKGTIPNARIALVISNNSASGILDIARSNGIPALHRSQTLFSGEEEFVEVLEEDLRSHRVDFIVLAGYMKRIPARLVRDFRKRMLNIHPALLPKFGGTGMYGDRVHRAVLSSGERHSGATVHLVDEEYDHGPIVLQRKVDISPGETVESLAAKVLRIEHEIYPEAVRLFAEGKVECDEREVIIHQHERQH